MKTIHCGTCSCSYIVEMATFHLARIAEILVALWIASALGWFANV